MVKFAQILFFALALLTSIAVCAQNQTTSDTNTAHSAQTNTAADNNYIDENGKKDEDTNATPQQDPYEKFNRSMFKFNETLDKHILKPIAKTYNALIPSPVNTAIDNILNNLSEIPSVINDLLQFNFYQATSDSWRFAINSTVGIGGTLDIANKTGLSIHYEDVGLTLAKWGWTNSNYLVLPFLGSSTIRDAAGLVPYYYMTVYPYIKDWKYRYAAIALRTVDVRARLLRFEKVYEEAAIDRYVFVRSAYLQRRKYLTNQNNNIDDPYTEEDTQATAADDNEETYYLDDM